MLLECSGAFNSHNCGRPLVYIGNLGMLTLVVLKYGYAASSHSEPLTILSPWPA